MESVCIHCTLYTDNWYMYYADKKHNISEAGTIEPPSEGHWEHILRKWLKTRWDCSTWHPCCFSITSSQQHPHPPKAAVSHWPDTGPMDHCHANSHLITQARRQHNILYTFTSRLSLVQWVCSCTWFLLRKKNSPHAELKRTTVRINGWINKWRNK